MDAAPWSRLKSEIYGLVWRNSRSNRRIVSIARVEPEHVILDIGCGPGAAVRNAATLAAKAVGVDRSEPMIEIARRRSRHLGNVEFLVAGAEALPFPDASFDRVWSVHAFHHWEDPEVGIEEAARVTRPGGRLLISEDESNGAHGMDREHAEKLADALVERGFAEATVEKRGRQLVVIAVR
ncbi:MAG: class I SAM-dependent methyltransferase [Acidimicrobiia bacterium]|nr:class I SAM-dependent methyltransferase [Acidimicrobiia bacterium]MDH4306592.1 class I SAM-dependent methyltransferase [Acidimicrobiia bacterium]MDH5294712.1 class I SAM-dependent methyltransferase [Acidimicrobiia bacterium]